MFRTFMQGSGRGSRAAAVITALAMLLAACGNGITGPEDGTGVVAGEVLVGAVGVGEGQAAVPIAPVERSPEAALATADAPHVPGELIVAFEPTISAAAVSQLRVAGVEMQSVRPLAIEGAALFRAPVGSLDELLVMARELEARPDVRYAHPNYLLFPARAPNDPQYDSQWHYGAIDMEGAWDVTVGNSDVVVAVLDTGILYSQTDPSKRHPDLVGRVLPGYDFISEPNIANDGDGRDPDPYDTVPSGDYHGTHVAGTIGAATDNGLGVAGVDWRAKLLPLRVLGAGGGPVADIADAIRWATGAAVPGMPSNSNPADVLNLSLGGRADECYDVLHDAITDALASTVVVVAAGNENVAANGFTPANCPGPIVVGATDRDGDRAWYSNYGSRIDVMAPGGTTSPSASNGVLSTGGGSGYVFMQGTSMAAPHVSGVVSLMKAVDPSVNNVVALAVLRASATALNNDECEGDGGSDRTLYGFDCGAGLIDARIALESVDSEDPPPPPPPDEGVSLVFDPAVLDLGASQESGTFTVTNIGDETAVWDFSTYYEGGTDLDNPGPVPMGAVEAELVDDPEADSVSGTLDPGESVDVRIIINREVLEEDGYYAIQPVFETAGQDFLYQVRFTKITSTTAELFGPMVVAAFMEDPFGNLTVSGSQSSPSVIGAFEFTVESGRNLIGAWSDENGNDEVDEGDFLGYRDAWVNVPAGGRVSGADVRVQPVVGIDGLPPGLIEGLESTGR